MSRTKTLLAGSVLALATAAGAAGCADGTDSTTTARTDTGSGVARSAAPNAGLTGTQLHAAFQNAVATGTAVHVKGSVAQGSSPFSMDLNLDKNGSSEGSVTQSGATVPIKVVDKVTYIQLTPQFLKLEAASDPSITPSVISAVQNKWVTSRTSVGQSLASGLGNLTGYTSFLGTIENAGSSSASPAPSASPSGSGGPFDLKRLTPAGTTTFNGMTVAVYKASDGSSAFFAASGPAYLEKVTASGPNAATLTFTWNKPVTVTAPPSSDIFTG